MPASHPCRLSVFLAHDAPVGVILRRGPSQWAQLTSWDLATDRFEPGQWFRGRVYDRRCDLSPDETLFVYFAAKHGPRADPDDIGEAWTAISRPPYFTAPSVGPLVATLQESLNINKLFGTLSMLREVREMLDTQRGV